QTGQLDANGKLTISLPTAVAPDHKDMEYRVEARVTDDAGREIAGTNAVLATYGSFRIGVMPVSYLVQAGGRVRAAVEAQTYAGTPVRTPIEARLVTVSNYGNRQQESEYAHYAAATDAQGRAEIEFAAPPQPPPGSSWAIEAA